MIEKLANQIRREYLLQAKAQNKSIALRGKLYMLEEVQNRRSKKIAELETKRNFYTLVDMYPKYADKELPLSMADTIVNYKFYAWRQISCGYSLDNLPFGELVKLWKTELNYKGNPVISVIHWGAHHSFSYWDLEKHTVKTVEKHIDFDAKKYIKKNYVGYDSTRYLLKQLQKGL